MQLNYPNLLFVREVVGLPDTRNEWEKHIPFRSGNVSGIYGQKVINDKTVNVIWFDGSDELADWIGNAKFTLRPYSIHQMQVPFAEPGQRVTWRDHMVHRGFYAMYANNTFENIIRNDFANMVNSFGMGEVYFVGYSLGAAMAQLGARDFVFHNQKWEKKVKLFTFASPRVGNAAYVKSLVKAIPDGERFVNQFDIVTGLPFYHWGYRHPYPETNLGGWSRFFKYSASQHYRESYISKIDLLLGGLSVMRA